MCFWELGWEYNMKDNKHFEILGYIKHYNKNNYFLFMLIDIHVLKCHPPLVYTLLVNVGLLIQLYFLPFLSSSCISLFHSNFVIYLASKQKKHYFQKLNPALLTFFSIFFYMKWNYTTLINHVISALTLFLKQENSLGSATNTCLTLQNNMFTFKVDDFIPSLLLLFL